MRPTVKFVFLVSVSAILFFGLAAAPYAEAESGQGSAYGAYGYLTLQTLVGGSVVIDGGPLPLVTGNAFPDFDLSDNLALFALEYPPLDAFLVVQVLPVATSSDLANYKVSSQAAAAVVDLIIPGGEEPQLYLHIEALEANAEARGCPPLPSGSTTLLSASLTGTLVTNPVTIDLAPPPNLEIFNAYGVRIVLNEQEIIGTGYQTVLTVNALHVFVDNISLPAVGTLNGEIIVSQAKAAITCEALVPTLSGVGAAAIVVMLAVAGVLLRRRKRRENY